MLVKPKKFVQVTYLNKDLNQSKKETHNDKDITEAQHIGYYF